MKPIMRKEKYRSYDDRFAQFSSSIEKLIITLIVLLFLSLVTTQSLLQFDSFRQWIVEVERLEGVAS
jgi:hypothetical protein